MIPSAFDYERVDTVDGALASLAEHGDEAKLLAGGHSLIPLMKMRLAAPAVLVDVGRVQELSFIRDTGDHLAIGALTRHRDLEVSPVLAEHAPLLAHAASHVGDPQVRHRGTIGGSLAHADPASDLPAAVLAMGGTLVAQGPGGERLIPATGFFRGFLESVLEPTEMLVEIRIPKLTGAGWSFQKFTRRAQDWAIVGVAAVHSATHTGVGLVNMGTTPLLATAVVEALEGGASPEDAATLAAVGTEPPTDDNGTAAYREHLARVLVRRALQEAVPLTVADD
ncbi:FAD binding domain-containing protein [Rhabdothermincola sediminis]|uniref:FAD binding domain-containing protein n=1 Tax=Rhabdothermincola sediminis TaxID=2751370 RepID=UPI001AA078F3|nr:xanthine dehydrogenase family protein subunit M [Rhabdothermincola sediminis]